MGSVRELALAISDHLRYVTVDGRRGAIWAYENGLGSCMEYSDLFIASARSLGMPSLYISGICGSGGVGDAGHAWVATNLPGHGWFGLDATWPGAINVDSGRLITRYCDPEDPGIILTHVGGDVSILGWGEKWQFKELTEVEAHGLLEIAESEIVICVILIFVPALIARISTKRELLKLS
jgi:hypothetical protein